MATAYGLSADDALKGMTVWPAEILGVDPDLAVELQRMRAEIAPNQVGRHGQLQEWLQDVDNPDNHHRHVSHLWGVFPGDEINPDTPAWFAAARPTYLVR